MHTLSLNLDYDSKFNILNNRIFKSMILYMNKIDDFIKESNVKLSFNSKTFVHVVHLLGKALTYKRQIKVH